jgi:hypothetical protein
MGAVMHQNGLRRRLETLMHVRGHADLQAMVHRPESLQVESGQNPQYIN